MRVVPGRSNDGCALQGDGAEAGFETHCCTRQSPHSFYQVALPIQDWGIWAVDLGSKPQDQGGN